MQRNDDQDSRFGFAVLGDDPVIHPRREADQAETKGDPLGFDLFVEDLAERLINSRHNAPLTVGVFAPWGQGKSTIMRMLQDRLEASAPPVPTVWFNPWKYRSREEVWKGLALELVRQVRCHDSLIAELRRKRGALKEFVARALFGHWVGDWGKELVDAVASEPWSPTLLHNFEETLDQLFSALHDALGEHSLMVLFIDDLDRCTPEPAAAVLEALKMVLNRKGLITVMGIAESELSRAIHALYSRELAGGQGDGLDVDWGRNYLRKIIQVPLHIPTISPEQFDDYVADCLSRSNVREALGDDPRWHEPIRRACGQNLREIKRFLNQFIAEWDKANANARIVGNAPSLSPQRVAFMLLVTRVSREFLRHCTRSRDAELLVKYQTWFIDQLSGTSNTKAPDDNAPEFKLEGDISLKELFGLCLLKDGEEAALAQPFRSGRDLMPYLRFGRVSAIEDQIAMTTEGATTMSAADDRNTADDEPSPSDDERRRIETIRGLMSEGRADLAEEEMRRAESMIDLKDDLAVARFQALWAEVDERFARFDRAAKRHLVAADRFATGGSTRERLGELLKLAEIALRADNAEPVIELMTEAIDIGEALIEDLGVDDQVGIALMNRAEAALLLDQLEHAAEDLARAAERVSGRGEARRWELVGWLASLREDNEGWQEAFGRARALWDRYSDPVGLARTHYLAALAMEREGRHDNAREVLRQAGSESLHGDDPELLFRIHDRLVPANTLIDVEPDWLAALLIAGAYLPRHRPAITADLAAYPEHLAVALDMAEKYREPMERTFIFPTRSRALWYAELADEMPGGVADRMRRIALSELESDSGDGSKTVEAAVHALRAKLYGNSELA
ncbi:MAG: hypothetical protein H6980_01300 [Gammaproteobacteria bacterium]|nr:hypothetical protein [Gammaproteobacteria bacterium]